MIRAFKQVIFIFAHGRQLVLEARIDMHMAGRAGAFAPAIAVDARHTVVDRGVPRSGATLDRDRIFSAVRLDENDCGHIFLFSIMLDETASGAFVFAMNRGRRSVAN